MEKVTFVDKGIEMEKVTFVDLIEVVASCAIQVRTKTVIKENGKEISSSYHRHVIAPGDDLSNEDARVRAIALAVHTPEVVAAYQTQRAA